MSRSDDPTSGADQGFRLRRAAREDAPALIELIVALADFEKITAPTEAEQQRLIAHGFGDRPRFEAWLAFWADVPKPVGYAVLFEAYSTFRASPTLYLEDVFVLPEYRRRGIGSALLRHCVRLAHERGCERPRASRAHPSPLRPEASPCRSSWVCPAGRSFHTSGGPASRPGQRTYVDHAQIPRIHFDRFSGAR